LDLRNSRPTSFCCQLLRCLECTVSWCKRSARSVHAVNGRVHGTGCKHGRVGAAAAFGSWTDHARPCTWYVHGRAHGPSVSRTRPCTRPIHGRVPRSRPSLRPVYTALYVPCTRPFSACTDRVHRRARVVYMVRPRPCTGYTYTVGYSVHGLVYGSCTRPLTAVCRLCTRPCTGHVHSPSVTR